MEESGGGCGDDDDTDDDTDDDVENPPAAPSNLKFESVGKYKATLSWTDNAGNEDGFKVEHQTVTKGWEEIADLPANTTEYTDTTLECGGIEYEYRVKAYNAAGDSDYSNTDAATTLECWTIYTLDSNGITGRYISIALDSNDKVHISYAGYGDLKYVTTAEVE